MFSSPGRPQSRPGPPTKSNMLLSEVATCDELPWFWNLNIWIVWYLSKWDRCVGQRGGLERALWVKCLQLWRLKLSAPSSSGVVEGSIWGGLERALWVKAITRERLRWGEAAGDEGLYQIKRLSQKTTSTIAAILLKIKSLRIFYINSIIPIVLKDVFQQFPHGPYLCRFPHV